MNKKRPLACSSVVFFTSPTYEQFCRYDVILRIKCYSQIQDFKLGGVALKKIAPSGGRRENCLGISCEKNHDFTQFFFIFFPFLGGARAVCAPPPGSAPADAWISTRKQNTDEVTLAKIVFIVPDIVLRSYTYRHFFCKKCLNTR